MPNITINIPDDKMARICAPLGVEDAQGVKTYLIVSHIEDYEAQNAFQEAAKTKRAQVKADFGG